MLNKQIVKVEEYYSTEEESSSEEEDEEEGGAIKVTKIPPETTEVEIFLFFENPKKVAEVKWKKWSMISLPTLLLSGLRSMMV